MNIWEKVPYTNFHDLNLDWIINELVKVKGDLQFVIDNASLKYADPIQWDITHQYQANTVVIDPATNIAYISTRPVPDNILITDTGYWTPIFDLTRFLDDLYDKIDEEATARTDADEALSDADKALSGRIDQEAQDRQTADQGLSDRIDQTNQAIADLSGEVDDLHLVDAKNFGVVGDGVTDDTDAIQALLSAGKSVYLSAGTYKTTKPLHMFTGTIRGEGFNTVIECTPTRSGCAIVMCGSWAHIENIRLQYAQSVNIANARAGTYIGLLTYTYASDNSYQNQRTGHRNVWIRHVGTGVTSDQMSGNPSPVDDDARAPFSVHFDSFEIQDFSYAGVKFDDDYCSGNIFTNIYITSPTGSVVDLDNPILGTAQYGFYIAGHERLEAHMINIEWGQYHNALYFINCNGMSVGTAHLEQIACAENDRGLVNFDHSSGTIDTLSVLYTRFYGRTGQFLIMLHDAGYHSGNLGTDWSEMTINNLNTEGLNTGIGISSTAAPDFAFLYRPAAATGTYYFSIDKFTFRTYLDDFNQYQYATKDPNNTIELLKFGNISTHGLDADKPRWRLCRYHTIYYATDTHKTYLRGDQEWIEV